MPVALPPGVVTTMFLAPTDAEVGTTAVIEVAETTVKLVTGTPPMETALAPVKLVPVMVTVFPPTRGPEVAATEVMVG